MPGDPITRPYLTDVDELRATPVVMRFGDGTRLVQKSGSTRVELIPTPDPDSAESSRPKTAPSKNPSIPRAAYTRGSRDSVLLCLARLNEMVAFPQSAKAQL